MASIRKLKPGQCVYDVHRYKMGNTSQWTWGVWPVHIKEVDPAGHWVLASWNGNPVEKFYTPSVKLWRVNEPEMEPYGFGAQRPVRKKKGSAVVPPPQLDRERCDGSSREAALAVALSNLLDAVDAVYSGVPIKSGATMIEEYDNIEAAREAARDALQSMRGEVGLAKNLNNSDDPS